MNGAIPNQQQHPSQPMETQAPIPSPQSKQNKLGIAILFIVFFLILALILNYFNILPLSSLFPNQLGWLPQRDVPNGTSQQSQQSNNVTISPTDQAKQTFISYLPTILNTSILPASSSGITLTNDQNSPQSFIASWKTKEKNIDSSVYMSHDLKKIIAVDFYVKDPEQLATVSTEAAESKATQIFSIKPKGTWGM